MRYYLPSDIGILLYFEATTYLGLDFNYYHVEDIFRSTILIEENRHFSYSSLAIGLSFPATEQLFLDFALARNYMRSYDPDASQFDRYTVTKGFNFKLGFSIFL